MHRLKLSLSTGLSMEVQLPWDRAVKMNFIACSILTNSNAMQQKYSVVEYHYCVLTARKVLEVEV